MKNIQILILLLFSINCKVKNTSSKPQGETKNYIYLLKNRKWVFTDGSTGRVKYPREYLMYDEKYEYYYVDDSLNSKELYHFSDSCNFDYNNVGKLKYGKYMVKEEDICLEVEVISDSIFSYWFDGVGTFNILEVK